MTRTHNRRTVSLNRCAAVCALAISYACEQPEPPGHLADDARYGVVEGPITTIDSLFWVTGGAITPDTTLVLTDANAAQLRVWHSGIGGRTIGRRGEGPKEFDQPTNVVVGAGIVVFDHSLRRFTYYDQDFEYIRTAAFANRHYISAFAGPFSDSVAFVSQHDTDEITRCVEIACGRWTKNESIAGRKVRLFRQKVLLLRQHVDSLAPDTLMTFGGPETIIASLASYRAAFSGPVPFGRATLWAANDSLLVMGTNDAYELTLYSRASMAAVGVIRRNVPRRVMPDGAVANKIEARRKLQMRSPRRNQAAYERSFVAYDKAAREWAPDSLPHFEVLTFDDAGHIWVTRLRAPGDANTLSDVFDANGNYLGTVQIPGTPTILAVAQGHLLVTATDEWDEQRAYLFRLIR